MRRVRRHSPEARIELTPLIDAVFLLLTFFIFSLVLMIRASSIDLTLPGLSAGSEAEATPRTVISIDRTGKYYLDDSPITLDQLAESLRGRAGQPDNQPDIQPDQPIVVAIDARCPSGAWIALLDRLTSMGLRNVAILGREESSDSAPDESVPSRMPTNSENP